MAPGAPETWRYVAFLRAINVGGHTVKMDRLRALFGALGFGEVETFIASGNVIFAASEADASVLEARIEEHLEGALGYAVATFLRTPPELAAIAAHEPFPAAAGSALYVGLTKAPPGEEARRRLMACRSEIDDFQVRDREVYWLCRTSLSRSDFSGAKLEKALGMPATLRNATTIRRLAAKHAVARP